MKSGNFGSDKPTEISTGGEGDRDVVRALDELETEGGAAARRARYSDNCATLVGGMRAMGFNRMCKPARTRAFTPHHTGFSASSRAHSASPGMLSEVLRPATSLQSWTGDCSSTAARTLLPSSKL